MSAPVIALRRADPADAGKLGAMITEAVTARAWKPRLHSGAEDIAHAGLLIDRGWVTVADCDEETRGFIAREGDFIHALFVASRFQRRGLGAALLRDAQARCPRLDLWTFERNLGAQRFYLRHGFVEVDRTRGDNEEGLPDIHYRWQRPGVAASAAHTHAASFQESQT
ncbi:GNAT family N-acetyltransferase [Maliponia aquimaris]|uniref:Putative acetyltransferase n=1 Tax=Maliponia aquimaris TaxID=1673631 RepID=A0A238L4C5_9RHOB|nr:GNAT family N-acetyltransferase [Maliponia aquimaris]SMX49176.1 putative acetyltransferase [Maliponia aquimaris]